MTCHSSNCFSIVWGLQQLLPTIRWVRLICGTAFRGTAEAAEPAEPSEPKEMTVLLQFPLANMIKYLVTINYNIDTLFTVPCLSLRSSTRALTLTAAIL